MRPGIILRMLVESGWPGIWEAGGHMESNLTPDLLWNIVLNSEQRLPFRQIVVAKGKARYLRRNWTFGQMSGPCLSIACLWTDSAFFFYFPVFFSPKPKHIIGGFMYFHQSIVVGKEYWSNVTASLEPAYLYRTMCTICSPWTLIPPFFVSLFSPKPDAMHLMHHWSVTSCISLG